MSAQWVETGYVHKRARQQRCHARGIRRTTTLSLVLLCLGFASCMQTPSATPVPASSRAIQQTPPAPAPSAATGPRSAIRADQQPVLVGTVLKVIDGDTIKVQLGSGPIHVRFDSIDAPEASQPWGPEARTALASRLDRQVVALAVTEQDRYERLVAVVYLDDENINGWMVQQGNAWAYRDYLDDPRYCTWESAARAGRKGLWTLAPASRNAPWEWRRAERGEAVRFTDYDNETVAQCIASARRDGGSGDPAVAQMPGRAPPAMPVECLIKGNISDNGRIYHVPGSPAYDRTKIDTSKGERWFCTEQEARAAGWRGPRN